MIVMCAIASPVEIRGRATAAGEANERARVELYATNENGPLHLDSDTCDDDGFFEFTACDIPGNAVLYVTAIPNSGNVAQTLGIIGNYGQPAYLSAGPDVEYVINELTSVAAIFSLQQFIEPLSSDGTIHFGGPSPGLQNAVKTTFNIANPLTGHLATTITTGQNACGAGIDVTPAALVSDLANFATLCTENGGNTSGCQQLLDVTSDIAPSNTVRDPISVPEALAVLAQFPHNDVDDVYNAIPSDPVFLPTLQASPSSTSGWVITLVFTERGFDGPGRPAMDEEGNTWWANNFVSPRPFCGQEATGTLPGDTLPVIGPAGDNVRGAPLRGGGVSGTGYGVMFDVNGDVWLGNYAGRSISQYSREQRRFLSPSQGYQNDEICHPQGMMSDQDGNIWIVNNGGGSGTNCSPQNVMVFPDGDPDRFAVYSTGISSPFDVAIDGRGRAWVTNAGNVGGSVTVLEYDDDSNTISLVEDITNDGGSGTLAGEFGDELTDGEKQALAELVFSLLDVSSPKTIAIDFNGDAWVVNFELDSLLFIDGDSFEVQKYSYSGLFGGWGMAVDGDNDVWVADFGAQAIFSICGTDSDSDACQGHARGDLKYSIKSCVFQHFTGVQVDQSGNLWAANNVETSFYSCDAAGNCTTTFQGGNGAVQVVGVAKPVAAPMLGLPQAAFHSSDFDRGTTYECDCSSASSDDSYSGSSSSASQLTVGPMHALCLIVVLLAIM